MNQGQLVALVLASGAVSGIAAAFVTAWTSRSDRKHRTSERTAIEEHESRLRRELAHDEARSIYLPLVVQIVAWFDKTASATHVHEVGSFHPLGTNLPMPTSRVDILDLLRRVMHGHPTQAVRDHARKLFDSVYYQWTEIQGHEIPDASLDQETEWAKQAEGLIELIHAPRTTPA